MKMLVYHNELANKVYLGGKHFLAFYPYDGDENQLA